jgi:shikimate dehydrogenase
MEITGKTKVCVLLGYPVAHSASPAMHNAAFRALGLDYVYIPWAVRPEDFPRLLEALGQMENFAGASVTIPHKEAALHAVGRLSPEASSIGAVNTIVPQAGILVGHNTDAWGFLASFKEEAQVDPRGKRIAVLGAGGGAKAVAYALAEAGSAEIRLFNQDRDRAQSLLGQLRKTFPNIEILAFGLQDITPQVFAEIDVLVNATPVGMKVPDPPLFNYRMLPPHLLVCDLIYQPPETPLLKEAKSRGCRTLNGLGMLLYQGVRAFELWTGREASVPVMRAALYRAQEDRLTGPRRTSL